MSRGTRLLIAVPHVHLTDFVSTADVDVLHGLFNVVEQIEPDRSNTDWIETLRSIGADAVLTGWGTPLIPFDASPSLRYVAHLAGSVRHLVTREAIEKGLWVTNWGSIHAPSVAECALMLTLCALRRVTHWQLQLHDAATWPIGMADPGIGLFNRRVGIHGFGQIAQHLVKLLAPFDCEIGAYSAGVPAGIFAEHGVRRVDSLQGLFECSEVLIEVEALREDTRGSIDERLLRSLPDGACFVNVGRGAVVDEAGMIAVAREGRIQFGLDVYESEPLSETSPLRGLDNVTLLPHIAGPTRDKRRIAGRRALENLKRYAAGEQPEGLITPELFDRST